MTFAGTLELRLYIDDEKFSLSVFSDNLLDSAQKRDLHDGLMAFTEQAAAIRR